MSLSALLAAATPSPVSTEPTVDPSRVTPGILGFLSLVLLGVAVYFLWRSLNKQVTRVDFDEEHTFTRPKDREAYEAAHPAAPEQPGAPDPTS